MSLDRCRVEVGRRLPLRPSSRMKNIGTRHRREPRPRRPARAHAPPAAAATPPLVGCLPECRPRPPRASRLIQPATLSRTAHVPAAPRRAPTRTPRTPQPRVAPPPTFNRQRTLFCCSGVCYSRCPRRRAHKSARSRQSSAAISKAAAAATCLRRPPRMPRRNLSYQSARLKETITAPSAHSTHKIRAPISSIRATLTLLDLKFSTARTVFTHQNTIKN